MNQANLFAVSDTGLVRRNNEDRVMMSGNLNDSGAIRQTGLHSVHGPVILCVVADGMGGENAGEVAAEIAADKIHHFLLKKVKNDSNDKQILDWLRESQLLAHRAVIQHARNHPDCIGMGTTVVLALYRGNKLYLGWTGDSRAYLFRKRSFPSDNMGESSIYVNRDLELLTNDHSLVWNEVLSGKITPEQARTSPMSNVITQVLGDPLNIPKPDARIVDIRDGDLILLCSDGLSGMISDLQIHHSIDSHLSASLEETANDLLLQAKLAGGKDNISFILYQHLSRPNRIKTITGFLNGDRRKINRHLAFLILFIFFSLGLVFLLNLLGWVDLSLALERISAPFMKSEADPLLPFRLDSGLLKYLDSMHEIQFMHDAPMNSPVDSMVRSDSLLKDSLMFNN